MKIKKPSLKGMKNCEYLGRFCKDEFIQQGHNFMPGAMRAAVGAAMRDVAGAKMQNPMIQAAQQQQAQPVQAPQAAQAAQVAASRMMGGARPMAAAAQSGLAARLGRMFGGRRR